MTATNLYTNLHATKHAGKVALITGGSTGIGLATAQRLAREGAHVVITGRRQPELDAAVEAIGHGARAVRADVSSAADLARVADVLATNHGHLDILFANAGGGEFAPLQEATEAQFDKTFGINVKGTLLTIQAALPLMRPGSAVVINASITSIQGVANFGIYAATKAALRSFARTFIVDLKGRGIRVNVVSPGPVITPAYRTELKLDDAQIEAVRQDFAGRSPMGRTGETDEIAKAVSFLASDDASYVNGVELFVDGGLVQI